MSHKIIVVGIGPGDPAYLLPKAQKTIENARILVGGKRALADFSHSGARECAIGADIPGVLAFIREALAEDDVVVMVSGDPGYYSLLDALRREFPPQALVVIPGVSSLQMAFARLALPWHEARLASFHGRVPQAKEIAYKEGALLGLLTDRSNNSRTIAQRLMELGWPSAAELHICSRLSYEDEEIIHTTLAEAASAAEISHGVLVVKA